MKLHRSATPTREPEAADVQAGSAPAEAPAEDGRGLFGNPFHISSDPGPGPAPGVAATDPDPASGPPAGAPPAAVPAPSPEPDPRPSSGPAAPVAPGSPVTRADQLDALDLTAVEPHRGAVPTPGAGEVAPGFLSPAPPRLRVESALVRLIATAGVVGIGTAVGAILVANHVDGWITGLSVSLVSVILAAVLWRSRRL